MGLELLFDEIFIVESDMLQFPSDIKDGVADAQLVQHFLGRFLHDFGARIVIFIHTVSKAHQAERIVLVFRSGDIRSEEHTSELQSLMRISYAVLRLNKKKSIILL